MSNDFENDFQHVFQNNIENEIENNFVPELTEPEPSEQESEEPEPTESELSETAAAPVELPQRGAELLRRLSEWLRISECEPFENADLSDDAEPKIGLYQLFEALAAQRHELKLYTKSGRQTQELLTQCIKETSAAVELLQSFNTDKPEIERIAVKPFLISLIEMDESLQRADVAMKTMQQTLQERLHSSGYANVNRIAAAYCDSLSWWSRFRKRKTIRNFAQYLAEEQGEQIGQIFAPFRQGFEMLRQRMGDVLKKHDIRRIDRIGEPVDPEIMQVVAVVDSETVPPGCVVDIVRAGYLWRDMPLRFADVCAARQGKPLE